jgi:hypothetical protein
VRDNPGPLAELWNLDKGLLDGPTLAGNTE